MKFFQVVSGVAFAIASVAAQVASYDGAFSITNPHSNLPYSAGKVLPVTYDIAANASSDLALSITLTGGNNSYIVTSEADVSKSVASAVTVNNVTIYEHTINYNLPSNLTAGSYYVVFHESSTASDTQVPITILAAVTSTSSSVAAATSAAVTSGSSTAAAATTTKTTSTLKNGAESMIPSKAVLSLAAVIAFAYLF